MYIHKPVLLNEILTYFSYIKGKIFVDATIGEGGHSYHICKLLKPALLIGIDLDKEILQKAKTRLEDFSNVILVNSNYTKLKEILKKYKITKVDGILFDLGASMYHFKKSMRGFSLKQDEILDMRFGDTSLTAKDIINNYSYTQLIKIFKEYGEERKAEKIVKLILDYRKKKRIETTFELKEIIKKAIPYRKGKIDPATRIFQALRIAVNDEFNNIKKGIEGAIDVLNSGGRLCVITFHSGEDRIVKNIFKKANETGKIKVLTSKVICPKKEEVKVNPSARSAKLRVCERTQA